MVDEIKAAGANFSTGPIGRIGAYSQGAKMASGTIDPVTDRVEISQLATWLGKYADLPQVRGDLVARVRAEVQAGTYETAQKWDQAIESLMEDLNT